ncbi:MAG TPA: lipoprotein-releasing ABC transporter permease subunit [Burkholderiales bacterium]|jgi:lipoprotein-releasing system permease protein|nr:lipoprotein-releasing ABC transporter permease subunit [Burkholderiales bacterium]
MQISRLPFELLVGLRYVRARRTANKNGFISFISLASVIGIALGVAALIIVLSVMNGFQKEVRDRMLSVVSHIEVFGGNGTVDDWQKLLVEAKQNKRVVAGAPYVEAQAMLVNGDAVRGAVIRGIRPDLEAQVATLQMKAGQLSDLKPEAFNVMLGIELARALGVRLGDKVTLIAPQGNLTPAGVIPRLKQFNVSGVFESGHFEYDSALALVAMEDAQKLFRVEGATGVRLKTTNLYDAPQIAEELSHTLTGDLLIRDWGRINRSWFAAVQVEKRMMFIILTLIVAVAAFNLVSMLVMMVTDKRADIAILRTLGASPRSIQKIFMIAGSVSGSLGTLVGALVGIVTALNIPTWVPAIEHLFGIQFLAKDIYFINSLPSDPQLPDIAFIVVTSLVLSLLATIYPSWRAARIQPAEALRYE